MKSEAPLSPESRSNHSWIASSRWLSFGMGRDSTGGLQIPGTFGVGVSSDHAVTMAVTLYETSELNCSNNFRRYRIHSSQWARCPENPHSFKIFRATLWHVSVIINDHDAARTTCAEQGTQETAQSIPILDATVGGFLDVAHNLAAQSFILS